MYESIDNFPLLTKSFSERQRNLANMRHLFHRRANECGETFPFRLPDDPQSPTKIARSIHHGIPGKRIANFSERMIEREVSPHQALNWTGELLRTRPPTRRRRSSALHQHSQRVAALLDINSAITNRSHKSVTGILPMKHLAGIKRLLEIEIRRKNFNHGYEDNAE